MTVEMIPAQPAREEEASRRPIPEARFDLGDVVVTHEAHFSLVVRNRHPFQLLARHMEGDWGELDEHDVNENEQSADQGGRIFSRYEIDDQPFYVITECDRSVTTVLLPEEY
jgi:hypothetical protein